MSINVLSIWATWHIMYAHGELLFPDYIAMGLLAFTLGFLLWITMNALRELWRSKSKSEGKSHAYLLTSSINGVNIIQKSVQKADRCEAWRLKIKYRIC